MESPSEAPPCTPLSLDGDDSARGRRRDRNEAYRPCWGDGADDEDAVESLRKRQHSRQGLDEKLECPHVGYGKSYSCAEHLYCHQPNHNNEQQERTYRPPLAVPGPPGQMLPSSVHLSAYSDARSSMNTRSSNNNYGFYESHVRYEAQPHGQGTGSFAPSPRFGAPYGLNFSSPHGPLHSSPHASGGGPFQRPELHTPTTNLSGYGSALPYSSTSPLQSLPKSTNLSPYQHNASYSYQPHQAPAAFPSLPSQEFSYQSDFPTSWERDGQYHNGATARTPIHVRESTSTTDTLMNDSPGALWNDSAYAIPTMPRSYLPHAGNNIQGPISNSGAQLLGNNINARDINIQTPYRDAQAPRTLLPHAVDAPFNSYTKRHEPNCLAGTRVDLLREIYGWAEGQDQRCIFWLRGLAGTGKSTIARTVARSYYDKECLAASFFFSRGGGDVGNADKFVASIAVQLAENVPAVCKHICSAVAERGDIASQSLRDQWQHLVLRPLSKLREPGHYVVVVDALDECDNNNDVQIIIQLLADLRSLDRVRLRVFLTSRPVGPIRDVFGQITDAEHKDFVLHDILPPIVDQDIKRFLENELQSVGQRWHLYAGWPSAENIMQLVQSASGLFIWAATACRFIRKGERFAPKRLETILRTDGNTTATPEKHLDQIYITVLRNSVSADYTREEREEQCKTLKHVLGSVVVLLSTLSLWSLSKLLQYGDEEVRQALADLHAILNIPEDSAQQLRLHHPSFRDFLLDKKRCNNDDFWVDQASTNEKLASRCLEHMSAPSGLRQNICNISEPGMLRGEMDENRITANLPPEMQYACRYWVDHLERSHRGIEDEDATHRFLKKHLLHWLEAMSLMRELSQCVHLLAKLQTLATSSASIVSHFLQDAKRFVLRFQFIVADAPLQLYYSALIFAPQASIIRKTFEHQVPRGFIRLSQSEKDWDACRSTLEGHSGYVRAVAFSPDGKLVMSASYDGTVRLWDAEAGAHRSTLEGHSGYVSAVAFSPDGKLIQTNRGDITLPSVIAPSPTDLVSQSSHIFIEDEWIVIYRKRSLWLPPEYRPTYSTIYNNVVCLGHSSGHITLLGFHVS